MASPQSLNLYSYVHNNPIDFTDPLGLFEGNQPPAPEPDYSFFWRLFFERSPHIISDPGNTGGGVPEPEKIEEDPCEMHRHNLKRSAIRNALNNAWNRSQYNKNKKLREKNAREQGGVLSSWSNNGQIVKRKDHKYLRPVSELRATLTQLSTFVAIEKVSKEADQTFDYIYHTHPFEQGDVIPEEKIIAHPLASEEDWKATRSNGIDAIIVTSKYFIVLDVKSGIECYISR